MTSARTLATQQARDAAKQLLAATGPLKDQIAKIVQQGHTLADPTHWGGDLAGKWRHDWGPDTNQLNQTAAKLGELERRAHQVVEDIFKADDALLAGVMPYQPPRDPRLDEILNNYQVGDADKVVWWPPWPVSLKVDPQKMTSTEVLLLVQLGLGRQVAFKDIKEDAFSEAEKRYPPPHSGPPNIKETNDGHMDAFRHAYWNARMASKFGQDFAANFATAHESMPGNPADREAMDLYNNEVGRRIAKEHPDASPEELANLVQQGIEHGEMVVIDGNHELAWSNQVPIGQHREANDAPRGKAHPVEPDSEKPATDSPREPGVGS